MMGFTSQIMYSLKRNKQNIQEIGIYQLSDEGTYDPATGVTSNTMYLKHTVKRAIVLPSELDTKFVYDLAFISASRNFTSGGEFNRRQVWIILDVKRDLRNVVVDQKDYIVIGDERYAIFHMARTQDGEALVIRARYTEGERPYRIIEESVCDSPAIGEENATTLA